MTGKQIAAVFANTGTALTGFTAGPVTGANSDTVVFTSTGSGPQTAITLVGGAGFTNSSGNSVAPTDTQTAGVAAVAAAGKGAIADGGVTIADANAGASNATISTVSLTNYANSTISSGSLSSLTLSGTGGTLGITNSNATSLDLTLSGFSGTNTITNNTYTTVKVHTTGSASTLANFSDTALTNLTVDGSVGFTLGTAPTAASSKITVSGAAGFTLATAPANVVDINASATSGTVSISSLNPTTTTYEGGSGTDNVTIALAPTKAISGGAGVNTLTINVAAGTFSNPSSNTFISGFTTLGLGAAATGSYDATGFTALTQGGIIGAVTYANVAAGTPLTLTNSPGGGITTYTLKDATGSSDALTINLNSSNTGVGVDASANTVGAAGIESVTVNSGGGSKVTSNLLTVSSDAAMTTLTVTGAKPLTLSAPASTALTSVDGSAMSGGLTYTTAGTVAETVKGGTGADSLTAKATATPSTDTADTLNGGAGNDTLTANGGLDTLTGGAGNDTFVIAVPGANVNSYSTITDASTGDVIQLKDVSATETFGATKVTLASTAVFQDYANAVAAAGPANSNGYVGWFQFTDGNTYIVESRHAGGSGTPSFVNGTDIVVKLTGTVDLSNSVLLQVGTAAPEIIIR